MFRLATARTFGHKGNHSVQVFSLLVVFLLAGCTADQPVLVETATTAPESEPVTAPSETQRQPPADASSSFSEGVFFGYTYHRGDGNRLLAGKGTLPDVEPLVIDLEAEPRWLAATPYREGSLWTVVSMDGIVETFYLHDHAVEEIHLGWPNLSAGTPPLVMVLDGQAVLVAAPSPDASRLSHPVVLDPERGRIVFLEADGTLILWEAGNELDRLDADALPDARLLRDEHGRLLFLSAPTDRYGHGVLGDDLEAGSISLVETDPTLKIIARIEIPDQAVVEGMAPIWTDLDGNGQREIIVTVSDSARGARLVVYAEDGRELGEGSAIGQGFRWRHQIAAAPFGANGEIMLTDVLTPHLGGVVEFFAWDGDRFVVQASLSGFSSHQLGSRNLDMAVAGDLDGDGDLELLVPDQSRQTLNGISLQNGSAELDWTLPLDASLTTNVAGVSLPAGSLAVGVGVDGRKLLVWQD